MNSPLFRRPVFAWALYDWANSAYATTVMVVFFPIFFKQTLTGGMSAAESTSHLAFANGAASLLLAIIAPLLGTLADKGSSHIRFLAFFTVIGVIPTVLLAFVDGSNWPLALLWFAISSVGFWGGLTFYDSMLVRVAPPNRVDSVSGFGYALGYLGGALLLIINVLMYGKPGWFGLATPEAAVRMSFLTVAAWWTLFAIPLFRQGVPDATGGTAKPVAISEALRASIVELARTFKEIRHLKPVILFLIAYWMYIDGVNTAMKMAVDYGLALGFPASSLILAILAIQLIGFPMTLLFGVLGDRLSPLFGIFVSIGVYSAVTLYAVFMTQVHEFYVMAIAIGCVQGAVQSMSRSYYSRLIPQDRAGEFYGFYNMMGKFASVLGPFLMGFTALLTGSSRYSILSLLLLFIAGGIVLVFASRSR